MTYERKLTNLLAPGIGLSGSVLIHAQSAFTAIVYIWQIGPFQKFILKSELLFCFFCHESWDEGAAVVHTEMRDLELSDGPYGKKNRRDEFKFTQQLRCVCKLGDTCAYDNGS